MSDLAKCKREGCAPVRQSRGQMKPEDHHMQYLRHQAGAEFMQDHGVWLDMEGFRRDAYETEDQGPDNAHDVRVSCGKCGKATPWMRRDIEEFRRHGDGDQRRHIVVRDGNLDATINLWNGMVNGHGDGK